MVYISGGQKSYFLESFTVSTKWMITTQKIKFSIKDFSSKCDQIGRKLRIWSHLLKKSLMENFTFCAVCAIPLRHSLHIQQKYKVLVFCFLILKESIFETRKNLFTSKPLSLLEIFFLTFKRQPHKIVKHSKVLFVCV